MMMGAVNEAGAAPVICGAGTNTEIGTTSEAVTLVNGAKVSLDALPAGAGGGSVFTGGLTAPTVQMGAILWIPDFFRCPLQ